MVVAVPITMAMRMPMRLMAMPVHLPIPMLMPLTRVALAVGARVFVEHEGLDGDGHRPGGHADAAEVYKVKAPQGNAVDDQHLAVHALVFL